MSGTHVSPEAEVRMVTPEGFYLIIESKGYFAAFKDFPYLADLPPTQIFAVEYCGHGHIRWDLADIDLHTDILANPEKYPVIMHEVSHAAAELGKIGGLVKSQRKASASRANGRKGGRPGKKQGALLV